MAPQYPIRGYRWVDLLDGDGHDAATRAAMTEPTQILPTEAPLLTFAQWWRATLGGRR